MLGVLGATLALYLANPRGFTRGCMTVYNTGVQTGRSAGSSERVVQWTRGEWLSFKLAVVERMKGLVKTQPAAPSKSGAENVKPKVPVYNPDEDALYDFTEEEAVNDDDLYDLDELDAIKLDIEA